VAVALEGHHVFLSVPVCTIIFAEWIICVLGTTYVSLVDVWGIDRDGQWLLLLKVTMLFFLSLFSGSIGFFSCFWFVTKIYSVVKVD